MFDPCACSCGLVISVVPYLFISKYICNLYDGVILHGLYIQYVRTYVHCGPRLVQCVCRQNLGIRSFLV